MHGFAVFLRGFSGRVPDQKPVQIDNFADNTFGVGWQM